MQRGPVIGRHQLPVWSPLTLRAIAAGILPSAGALSALERLVRSEYQPAGMILTGSGTIALALAYLASAAPGARPRVALPAWACPDLMTAADAADAEVLLYDLDPVTLAPDLESLRAVLRDGPTAVVVAHWFGVPVDLGLITELASAAGARLIDDAAQGVGASMRGTAVGAGGDYGVLSFGRGKGRTGGAGGALLANTAEAAGKLGELASRLVPSRGGGNRLGSLFGQWAFGRPWLYGLPMKLPALKLGQTVYHPAPQLRGMDAPAATVLSTVWNLSAVEVVTRRTNAERWRELLEEVPGVTPYPLASGAKAGWLRFPVMVSTTLVSTFRSSRMARHGVSTGYPSLLGELPLRNGRLAGPTEGFPGSLLLSQNLFALPVHRRVRQTDFREILWCVQRS